MADDKTTKTPPQDPPPPPPRDPNETVQEAVMRLAGNGVSPAVTDAVTQALVMILGSGPSIAAFDGLLSVQQANGIMYHNAVANQQKTNLLGMAMTAKCVRYMMDPLSAGGLDESILDEETGA